MSYKGDEIMDITLRQAYDLFISDREVSCADKTILYYKENLFKFIDFVGSEDLLMNDLPKDIFQNYVKYLRTRTRFPGNYQLSSDKKLKNTTVRTYARAVKTFLNFCRENDYLEAKIRITKMPKDDADQIIPLYQEEVDRIDALFKDTTEFGLRNYCIIHLMLDAGFRSSDVINLKLSDIMFEKNVIRVEHSKGDKSRMVLLSPRLKTRLYKYCVCYRRYVADDSVYLDQPVFTQMRGEDFINQNVIKQLFKRLKKRTGIERLHPHLLRHTFATSYIMGGGNIEMLRLLLGHYDYNVTRGYLHLANTYSMLGANIYHLDPVFFRTVY